MSRRWHGPDQPPPPPEPAPDAPRSTVPHPPHARLVETLREIYGLDDDCTDDAIALAALQHAPR